LKAHPLGVGHSFDEVVEELAPFALTPLVGVLALALEDGHELRTGLEESASFAGALEDAAEESGSRAVTVGQQPTMVGARRWLSGAAVGARFWLTEGVGIRPDALVAVERCDGSHLFVAQCEIEKREVLLDPRSRV
jgi:hypothetical protein